MLWFDHMAAVEIKPVLVPLMDDHSNHLSTNATVCGGIATHMFQQPSVQCLPHELYYKRNTLLNEEAMFRCNIRNGRHICTMHFQVTDSHSASSCCICEFHFPLFECHSSCKTIATLHLCHKPTGAVQAPCGLVKSVLYMHVIMLMCIQLHDCPLWPSVVLPAIDQGRVSGARSGTTQWWIYQLLRQACSVFPDDSGDSSLPLRYCHVETFVAAHFKRQGRVSQSTLRRSCLPGSYQTSSRCTAG